MSGVDKPSREERLAARLRDNLRRRRAQERARAASTASTGPADAGSGLPKREDGG